MAALLESHPLLEILVLESEPDESLCRYFEDVAGLVLPERFVLPHHHYLALGRSLETNEMADHPLIETLKDSPAL